MSEAGVGRPGGVKIEIYVPELNEVNELGRSRWGERGASARVPHKCRVRISERVILLLLLLLFLHLRHRRCPA